MANLKELYGEMFTIGDIASEERYDLAKFMPFVGDTYDALSSPFLLGISNLPVWRYYKVNDGFKDIDLIATDAYGIPVYSSLIQIYNGTTQEVFPEDTILKLFSMDDLEQLYANILDKNFTNME